MPDGYDTEARVKWLTAPEAAKALGMRRDTFWDVATRLGWRYAKHEDGSNWFAVPLTELEREAVGSPYATSLDDGYPARVAQATAELIAAKTEAESRAEAAAQELAELRQQLARAESERDAAYDALRAAEVAAAESDRLAETARLQAADYARLAEEARQSFAELPWWRRLLGAPT